MKLLAYLLLLFLCFLTHISDGVDAVRLIREAGFKEGSHFYHLGNGGYTYHYNLDTKTSVYFKCAQFKRQNCHGRAILRIGGGFRETQAHNHPPDPNFVGERHFRQNVIEGVQNARRYVSFKDIVDEARNDQRYAKNVRSRMTLRRLRSTLYRARSSRYPPIPHSLQDLTRLLLANKQISKTVDQSDNMYAGSVTATDGSHHVAFFSKRMLRFMARVKIVQSDGTFKARPATPPSSQCFVLVTTWRHVVIPLGWVLMEKRSYAAYRAVLELLKTICPNFSPETVMTDWEYAQQKAWQDAFPNAQLLGCLWHLCRAFVKKIQSLRLVRYRNTFPNILDYIRKACAISLLPREFFQAGLNIVKEDCRRDDPVVCYLLRDFFSYVQDRWINRNYRSEWMSLFDAIHRTNNACETHNKMLRSAVGAYRPNVFLFIEALAQLEHNADLDVNLQNEGEKARRTRSWKSILADRRLEALTSDFKMDIFNDEDTTIRNFLNRASFLYYNAFNGHVDRAAGAEGNR